MAPVDVEPTAPDPSSTRPSDPTAVTGFVLDIPADQVADLHERLRRARLAEPEPVSDWSQGIPATVVSDLARAWLEEHDVAALSDELNGLGQFRTEIDGLGIHFLHVESPRRDAQPLLLTHGWPGSVVEFLDVVGPLTAPDDPSDPAFHLVMPSLPGFGFSDKPTVTGWGIDHIADAWAVLMARLGYPRFLAQGGDWGAMITAALGVRHPDRVAMLHTTMPLADRPEGARTADLPELEQRWLAQAREFREVGSGYSGQQRTRPQTLGYALVDSPVGQLAWIAEKFGVWTDGGLASVSRRRLLDNVAVYWFGASGASSARMYWENADVDRRSEVTVPAAISIFPAEMAKMPRSWVEARYTDVRRWSVLDRGGHFASLEVPDLFVDELRASFRGVVC
ncbi:epoxide hydrolase family protein [Actinomycetospora sp. NBRC 106378]|uniref:epoxide hydrolase family protein n=1 Tax=Actinomycetospora sp. NBRC 106378 TaxID=3032208 RepID=UPI0024A07C45|nr:epoxide hydrolase family protein [Actinomycetospora sp. NBRC 106378]GLZ54224.1 epoxide hydrolase [Actinomycetospora sp. NBRC 106378]